MQKTVKYLILPSNYFGKASKNVLKNSVTSFSNMASVDTQEYVYTFDAKGNATSIVIKNQTKMGGGAIDESSASLSLTYNCK